MAAKTKKADGVNPSAFNQPSPSAVAVSNQPSAIDGASEASLLLLLLLGRRLGGEKRGRLRRDPVEQVARFHEAAGVRARAEDHHGHVLAAALEAQHGREAVARLGDEAGLPRTDVDV